MQKKYFALWCFTVSLSYQVLESWRALYTYSTSQCRWAVLPVLSSHRSLETTLLDSTALQPQYLGSYPSSNTYWLCVGRLLSHSGLIFPICKLRIKAESLWGLNKLTCRQCLLQCLAHRQCYIVSVIVIFPETWTKLRGSGCALWEPSGREMHKGWWSLKGI